MKKFLNLLQPVLITLILGLISGIITGNVTNEYAELIKPSFAPPSIVFPIVWTILYILMGVSFGLAYQNDHKKSVIIIYVIQLFFNLTWSIIFFGLDMYLLSAIWIMILIVCIVIMIYIFYQENKLAGLLQIPYLLWCIFAFVLNIQIYLLNM